MPTRWKWKLTSPPARAVFLTVGLPDAAVRESSERIRSAINNCGLQFPWQNITVNLAPADVKKEGSGFDLPSRWGFWARRARC